MALAIVSITLGILIIYAAWVRIECQRNEQLVKEWRQIAADLSNDNFRIKTKLLECKRKRNHEALELLDLRRFKQRFAALIAFTRQPKRQKHSNE